MNETVNYGTAILPTELDFVKEVVKPGDIMYVLSPTSAKTGSTFYRKVTITKTYKHIVQTTDGSRTWTDVVMGYRYTVKAQNGLNNRINKYYDEEE